MTAPHAEGSSASAPDAGPGPTPNATPTVAHRPASPLLRDAFITVVTRFGLAVLIFATDIALARLLGPSAKGRFALVLLYSQLAALIVGWGMDQALAVVAGRDKQSAARGWRTPWSGPPSSVARRSSSRSGCTAFQRQARRTARCRSSSRTCRRLSSPLRRWRFRANCSSIGLFALLGRKRVLPYSLIRVARRGSCWP